MPRIIAVSNLPIFFGVLFAPGCSPTGGSSSNILPLPSFPTQVLHFPIELAHKQNYLDSKFCICSYQTNADDTEKGYHTQRRWNSAATGK